MSEGRLRGCAVAAVAVGELEDGGSSMLAAIATSDLFRGNSQLARTY